MFCEKCGHPVNAEASFCAGCGIPTASTAPGSSASSALRSRPIAGIIVALVLGVIGIVWGLAQTVNVLWASPSGVRAALLESFPAFAGVELFGASVGFIANSAVVIGALLSNSFHPSGPRVVRISCWTTILMMLLMSALSLLILTQSASWPQLAGPTKASLIGGVVGGFVGGVGQFALILFLFRKRSGSST